jgi:excinuclease ABC subunit A
VRHDGPKAATQMFSEKYGCPTCGISMPELEPRHFSFNSPFGACATCSGLGTKRTASPELILGDPTISILEGVILPWGEPDGYLRRVILPALAKQLKFELNTPWGKLPDRVKFELLFGTQKKKGEDESRWEGILSNVQRRYSETTSDAIRGELEAYMVVAECPDCNGRRLKKESLAVTIHGRNIGEFTECSAADALAFALSVPVRGNGKPGLDEGIAGPILKEVSERLRFLVDVGLDYLTLDRSAESLSGGEAQRIRLATQIGSRLVGVLYILDEPSIGLHQRDNARLLDTLKRLRDLGNTVLVVEHDEETIMEADHLIDLGLGAGKHGGSVIAEGTVKQVMAVKASITGQYLNGVRTIPMPSTRRPRDKERVLRIEGAREHNLQKVNAEFPLGLFVAVTGVSGSGKSTLVEDILQKTLSRHFFRARVVPGQHDRIKGLEHLDKVIDIDQTPIGARRAPIRRPTPGSSRPSATSSPRCRRRSSAATARAASRST